MEEMRDECCSPPTLHETAGRFPFKPPPFAPPPFNTCGKPWVTPMAFYHRNFYLTCRQPIFNFCRSYFTGRMLLTTHLTLLVI